MIRTAASVALVLLSVPAALGGNPVQRTFDVVVADTGNNTLMRLADLDQDSFFEPGEAIVMYDDSSALGIALSNAANMAYDDAGILYVTDTTLDTVFRFNDLNGDGDTNDAGEAAVWLDNTNQSSVTFTSVVNVAFDAEGRLFGVNAGTAAGPLDFVFVANDLDGNGDANGVGEVTIVYDSTNGALNIAVPFGLAIDPDNGDVLVSDVNPDGIYRLHDGNGDGDFYDAGEATLVYSNGAGKPAINNVNSICFGPNHDLYANDASTDVILKLVDLNLDGDYEDAGEAVVWGSNPFGGSLNQFGIAVDEHARVYAVENTNSDQLLRYADLNGDGDALDAGEAVKVMDFVPFSGTSTLARAVTLVPAPRLTSPNPQPVPIPGLLLLDVHGAAFDDFVLLLGAMPLGFDAQVPPFGTLGFVPLLFSGAGNLGPQGQVTLSLPVPPSAPSPLTVHFAAAVGKAPYRTYLTNGLAVSF